MIRSYVGFWPRAIAFLLDYIIIAAYLGALILLSLTLGKAFPGIAQVVFGKPLTAQLGGFLTVTLPVSLYFALLEASAGQATWGKQRRQLKVVNTKGERISLARALGRTALKFIPWELAHTCVWQVSFASTQASPLIMVGFAVVWLLAGVNIVSLWLSPAKQTIYDRLAGTYVVRK